jgi:hypothetical protein
VYRWLCQLRVAPYSYDWIDNWGRQSPRSLTPGLEDLAVGQRLCSIFELVSFERDRQLTMRVRSRRARQLFGEFAGTYSVEATDSGQTRLRGVFDVHYASTVAGRAFRHTLAWGDLVMMRKQFLNLKHLAETTRTA